MQAQKIQPEAQFHEAVSFDQATKPESEFRFKAVIDFVEVLICTSSPTNFPTVRRLLDVPFADPVNAGDGGAATTFTVRFHDPRSWAAIQASLKKLEEHVSFAKEPEVQMIEVALDAYHHANDRDALVDMAARYYRLAANLVSNNHRFAGKTKASVRGVHSLYETYSGFAEGLNLYIGDRTDDCSQHIYVKQTDHGGQALPERLWRARMEIRLQGEALPVRSISDWESFEFGRLGSFFKFRVMRDDLSKYVIGAVKTLAQIGNKNAPELRRKRRVHTWATKADAKLNAYAYDALRCLTKRMGRKPKKGWENLLAADFLGQAD